MKILLPLIRVYKREDVKKGNLEKDEGVDDEYLKYSFYPYALVSFSSIFMLNKYPNALKVHTYDQVIDLVELCKIGGKTTTEATGEATEF